MFKNQDRKILYLNIKYIYIGLNLIYIMIREEKRKKILDKKDKKKK